MDRNIKSNLIMDKLFFDKINFTRVNWDKNDNDISFTLSSEISVNDEYDNIFKVELTLRGEKKDEYNIELVLIGIFIHENAENLDIEFKDSVIRNNTIAIMLPYMRSQVSILTAQPGVDGVVLPILNVSAMFEL